MKEGDVARSTPAIHLYSLIYVKPEHSTFFLLPSFRPRFVIDQMKEGDMLGITEYSSTTSTPLPLQKMLPGALSLRTHYTF